MEKIIKHDNRVINIVAGRFFNLYPGYREEE